MVSARDGDIERAGGGGGALLDLVLGPGIPDRSAALQRARLGCGQTAVRTLHAVPAFAICQENAEIKFKIELGTSNIRKI